MTICMVMNRKYGIPFQFRARWCWPIWWYLLNCRLSSWLATPRWYRMPLPTRNSYFHGSWHRSNHRWSRCQIHPLWNCAAGRRLRGWHCRPEGHHRGPIQQLCSQSLGPSRSFAFGTCGLQFWREGVFPVHWHASRWGGVFCVRSVVTVLPFHCEGQWCGRGQNRSCRLLCRQCRRRLRMCLG